MGFSQWLQQLDFSSLIDLGITVIAALTCIIFHECAHGLVAYWLGDRTAKNAGRLTLNPLRHVDWIGLVMMAVAKVGWAKPVPVNPRNFKNPKLGMAITAAAGPICNLLMAVVSLLLMSGIYYVSGFVTQPAWFEVLSYVFCLFQYIAIISCGLVVFNLIPIPPLDGSKVLAIFLPDRAYQFWMRYEFLGMFVLIALVVLLPYVTDFSPVGYLQNGLYTFLAKQFFIS